MIDSMKESIYFNSMKNVYPISAVAKATGLSIDTLRAWERRYSAVVPRRSRRGRLYSEHQLKRLQLLRQATESGYAIGQVARIDNDKLTGLVRKIGHTPASPAVHQSVSAKPYAGLLTAIGEYDYAKADRELRRMAFALADCRSLVHHIALPLMREVGERWRTGRCSVAQEHMLTSLLTGLLSSYIGLFNSISPPARILFATPSSERHGFANLAAALLAAAGGLGVVDLGTDLPVADIVVAVRKSKADVVILSLATKPQAETWKQLRLLARKLPKSAKCWIGGPADVFDDKNALDSRWEVLRDFGALEDRLIAIGAKF
jgi:MerR family transcriptional regulator, light-induced transcriptional regulator